MIEAGSYQTLRRRVVRQWQDSTQDLPVFANSPPPTFLPDLAAPITLGCRANHSRHILVLSNRRKSQVQNCIERCWASVPPAVERFKIEHVILEAVALLPILSTILHVLQERRRSVPEHQPLKFRNVLYNHISPISMHSKPIRQATHHCHLPQISRSNLLLSALLGFAFCGLHQSESRSLSVNIIPRINSMRVQGRKPRVDVLSHEPDVM